MVGGVWRDLFADIPVRHFVVSGSVRVVPAVLWEEEEGARKTGQGRQGTIGKGTATT